MGSTGDHPITAVVYMGDAAIPDQSGDRPSNIFQFAIKADAEPDVLVRVANIFNLANVAPLSANLQRDSFEQADIVVEIQLMSNLTADMIRRKLMQLTCIISVESTVQTVSK